MASQPSMQIYCMHLQPLSSGSSLYVLAELHVAQGVLAAGASQVARQSPRRSGGGPRLPMAKLRLPLHPLPLRLLQPLLLLLLLRAVRSQQQLCQRRQQSLNSLQLPQLLQSPLEPPRLMLPSRPSRGTAPCPSERKSGLV